MLREVTQADYPAVRLHSDPSEDIKKNLCYESGSGSSWISLFLAPLHTDPDPYIIHISRSGSGSSSFRTDHNLKCLVNLTNFFQLFSFLADIFISFKELYSSTKQTYIKKQRTFFKKSERIFFKSRKPLHLDPDPDPDPVGSEYYWLSWIQIRI